MHDKTPYYLARSRVLLVGTFNLLGLVTKAMKQQHGRQKSINNTLQADLYFQLARLDSAGFPAQQAFALLEGNNQLDSQLSQMQRHLKSGRAVAKSGRQAGLFKPFDEALLNAGEISGSLGQIYEQLADYYSKKAIRARQIKSKLALPAIVVMLAIFIQPLPDLVGSKISGLDYLLMTVGTLFKLMLLIYIGLNIINWLTTGPLKFLGLGPRVHRLQLTLPIVSDWIRNRQVNGFCYSLGLMLKAGLPALDAITKGINTIHNPLLRSEFNTAIPAISAGQSITSALMETQALNGEMMGVISVGEQSGKLAEAILHQTNLVAEKHSEEEALWAEWLPRLIYFTIALQFAIGIIQSNPFAPIVV